MASALEKPFAEQLYTLHPDDGSERRTPIFRELEVVRLRKDVAALEGGIVRAGSVGTVVFVHGGGVTYDVEINDDVRLVSAFAADLEPADG